MICVQVTDDDDSMFSETDFSSNQSSSYEGHMSEVCETEDYEMDDPDDLSEDEEMDLEPIDFRPYLNCILEKLSGETECMSIDDVTLEILDSMFKDLFHRIGVQAASVMSESRGIVMTHDDMETAIDRVLPVKLAGVARTVGSKALSHFIMKT